MRYFIVTAKCGHVGRDNYIPIDFAVKAESASKAASYARDLPRVKHDYKDAILSVQEVDIFDYSELDWVNRYDPYLQCTTRREQMQEYEAIYHRIREEARPEQERTELPEKAVYSGKKRIRNVRRYAKEQAFAYALKEAN